MKYPVHARLGPDRLSHILVWGVVGYFVSFVAIHVSFILTRVM